MRSRGAGRDGGAQAEEVEGTTASQREGAGGELALGGQGEDDIAGLAGVGSGNVKVVVGGDIGRDIRDVGCGRGSRVALSSDEKVGVLVGAAKLERARLGGGAAGGRVGVRSLGGRNCRSGGRGTLHCDSHGGGHGVGNGRRASRASTGRTRAG